MILISHIWSRIFLIGWLNRLFNQFDWKGPICWSLKFLFSRSKNEQNEKRAPFSLNNVHLTFNFLLFLEKFSSLEESRPQGFFLDKIFVKIAGLNMNIFRKSLKTSFELHRWSYLGVFHEKKLLQRIYYMGFFSNSHP